LYFVQYLEAQVFNRFAFIVKRFRVFRAPLQPDNFRPLDDGGGFPNTALTPKFRLPDRTSCLRTPRKNSTIPVNSMLALGGFPGFPEPWPVSRSPLPAHPSGQSRRWTSSKPEQLARVLVWMNPSRRYKSLLRVTSMELFLKTLFVITASALSIPSLTAAARAHQRLSPATGPRSPGRMPPATW
jgi:hypothetical protein